MKNDKRNIEKIKAEYFRQLRRWKWIDTDKKATSEDVDKLLCRLAELYQELKTAGIDVPTKLK